MVDTKKLKVGDIIELSRQNSIIITAINWKADEIFFNWPKAGVVNHVSLKSIEPYKITGNVKI